VGLPWARPSFPGRCSEVDETYETDGADEIFSIVSESRDHRGGRAAIACGRPAPTGVGRAIRWVGVLLLFVLVTPSQLRAESAAEIDLGSDPPGFLELMARFSQSGVVRARVEETRTLALLSEPIETEGVVYFAPPSRLARYTTRPGKSRVVVNGTRVAFSDETGHRTMDLEGSEVAQTLIGNLMFLLRGDAAALRERYVIAFRTARAGWELDLEPRSRAVRALIERTVFRGEGSSVSSMETIETNGDHSIARFLDVETGVEIAPAELDRIFSLASAAGGES
jgi:outer membrane lipoprotein-sorting protein